jgi:cyclic pyranopterin phosphate synthase
MDRPPPTEAEEPTRDPSGVLVDVVLGYECNVRCDHCAIPESARAGKLTTARVLAELARARSVGAHRVAFRGGEPTIRRDLLPLVRFARDRGFDQVRVDSNGLMFSYESYARAAVAAGVTDFRVSVTGLTPEAYQRTTGSGESFGRVAAGVGHLVAGGHAPVADVIVMRDTVPHLGAIVRFWAGLGVRTFHLRLAAPADRDRDAPGGPPRVDALRAGLAGAFEAGRDSGVHVLARALPHCFRKGWDGPVADVPAERVLRIGPGFRSLPGETDPPPGVFPPKCAGCSARAACPGVQSDFLDRHGDDGIDPFP